MTMPVFDCDPVTTAVLLIDVQERFRDALPAIAADRAVGRACRLLLAGATLLALPVVVSRQYPQGLGDTLPHLREAAPDAQVFDKHHFSCLHDSALRAHLAALDRGTLVIAGIEAHVCVLATVADAIRHGYRVIVCGDAIASRDRQHVAMACEAMRDLGALVLPVESVLFRVQQRAGVEPFRSLSRLVR